MTKHIVISLVFSFSSLVAHAAGPCDAALTKDVYSASSNLHEDWRLSLLITKDNYDDAKHNAGLSSLIYGVPAGLKYEDYSTHRAQIFQSYNESRTADEVRSVALTSLGETSLIAYSECIQAELMKSEGLHAEILSITESQYTILVRWYIAGVMEHANVTWVPTSVLKQPIRRDFPQGMTPISVPRPSERMSLSGSFMGHATDAIVLEPLIILPKKQSILAQSGIDFDGDQKKDSYEIGSDKIVAHLATGQTKETALSSLYQSHLTESQWLYGDFNGDGYTDLAHVIKGHVNDPRAEQEHNPSFDYYIHVFISNRDGTFSGPSKFYFADGANYEKNYNATGTWSTVVCNSKGRTDLVHRTPNGMPGALAQYYWISEPDGMTFSINAVCPEPH